MLVSYLFYLHIYIRIEGNHLTLFWLVFNLARKSCYQFFPDFRRGYKLQNRPILSPLWVCIDQNNILITSQHKMFFIKYVILYFLMCFAYFIAAYFWAGKSSRISPDGFIIPYPEDYPAVWVPYYYYNEHNITKIIVEAII